MNRDPHPFRADPGDRSRCTSCPLPKRNSVHDALPETPPDARAFDERRLGERPDPE